MKPRVLILAGMALPIGAISALVAFGLVWLIDVITNLAYFGRLSAAKVSPGANHLGIWAVLVPVIGGLIIGAMARYGSPKIRGHGIPEALEAILISSSRIEPKVAVLKPVSSALSIGTGGPFGAEGPIIMTGGAFGSLVAQFSKLTSIERRILLAAGAAAGMSAIFAAPVAAILLAIELLLFEWKPRSFIPVTVAAIAAAVLRVPLMGAGPIFPVTPHAPLNVDGLAVTFVLGLAVGLLSGLVTNLVYKLEETFERLPIHWMWWPASGGLAVGLGGLIEPRVLGVGYDVIHALLQGQLVGGLVLGLLVAKALVWGIALGSGTSGGVLAPLLIIRGAAGALAARWIPIGDAAGRLAGIITRGDVLRALEQDGVHALSVLEAGSTRLVVAYPDEALREAVERMLRNNIGRLPVVSRDDPGRLVCYLGRTGIMEARLRKLQDENLRESSWTLPNAAAAVNHPKRP